MSPEELARRMEVIRRDMPLFLLQFADIARARIAAAAVSKYMIQGKVRMDTAVDPRRLTIRTGRLARSITGQNRQEQHYERRVQGNILEIIMGSLTPYAGVHERGFTGAVNVREHRRMGHTVRAHTRQMNIRERPYLQPAVNDQSQEIQNRLRNEFVKFFESRLA